MAMGVALLGTSPEAAADGVIYDDESLVEVPTEIVVRGVDALGDVMLVVYPYPCALGGAITRLEEALASDPDAKLEGWSEEEEDRGYHVVREGAAFASLSNYEGPYNLCYFFGLPRAAFPEQDGAIARLEEQSDGGRWRLFSRDPAVLRTGVPLAMAGLKKSPGAPRSRVVTYAARLVDGALKIEATEWAWTTKNGRVRREDPRKLSRAALLAVEPHDELDLVDEQPWFAGSLAEVAKRTGSEGHVEKDSLDTKAAAGPAVASAPAVKASASPGPVAGPVQIEPARAQPSPGWWDSRLWYGGACLLVALGAGLVLRRGR